MIPPTPLPVHLVLPTPLPVRLVWPTSLPVHLALPTPLPVHVTDEPNVFITYFLPLVSTLAAVVAAWAAVWALKGLNAANETLRITKQQAEMVKQDRERRPNLALTADYRSPGNYKVELTENGNASIAFYITNFPRSPENPIIAATNVNVRLVIHGFEHAGIGNTIYLDHSGFGYFSTRDVAPKDAFSAGQVIAKAAPGKYTVQWNIISNEGEWPGIGQYHSEEIEVLPHQAVTTPP